MAYKHNYDKILARLVLILSRLNDGEALSVKDLAEEFNVSSKTIQRDFNERLISFPIYQDKKRWHMQDGFKLEKTSSLYEQLVLDVIEKITQSIGGQFSLASNQLLSKIKNETFNPIYTKINIEDISDKFKDIQIIEKAIKDKIELSCSYENERQGRFDTVIQPLKIVNYEGFWYLVAVCDQKVQKYYLKTLSNIKLTEIKFYTDEEIEKILENSLSIWFKADIEPFEVILHTDEIASKYFLRRPLPTQKILSNFQDGSMEFTVSITDEMEIIPLVKQWIPHVEVLEPKWIRDMIYEDLDLYIQNRHKDV